MIEFLKYLLLGFLQGVAEVLPISSSGHLAIASSVLGLGDDNLAFEVFLHMASLIAVIAFLFKPICKLIKGTFLYIFKKDKTYEDDFKYLIKLIISTIPIVIFTVVIKLLGYDTSPIFVVGICLIINAIMIFVTSSIKYNSTSNKISFKDAIWIGLFQCAGIFPGISRSGSSLCGAFVRKVDKEEAANYAFMLFIPAVIGAFVLELSNISAIFTLNSSSIACYLAAFLVSMVTTYFAFKILLSIIRKGKLSYFSIYCIIAGIVAIIYSACNGWI